MTRRHSTRWQLKGWTITVLLAAAFTTGCMHHPGGIAPSTKPLAPGGYIDLVIAKADKSRPLPVTGLRGDWAQFLRIPIVK